LGVAFPASLDVVNESFTHLMPFSPQIYTKLLQAQIPKAQKDSQVISVFLCFWDLSKQNLHVNMLMKLTQGQFSQTYLHKDFTCADPKRAKRQSSHLCLITLFGSEQAKAAGKHVDEIDVRTIVTTY